MKRPPHIKTSDKAVILSPAGKIDASVVHEAAAVLEGWGLHTVIGDHAISEQGRYSGSVDARLCDLQKAFDDPEVKVILCSRGGYGVVHLLSDLDFTGIRANPKWVIGYSDITALHAALQLNGIASIHGPMAKHFSDEGAEDLSVQYTKSIISGHAVDYYFPVTGEKMLNRSGEAGGRLFGGNLSVFCSILGTRYARIPRNGILFIEDIGEAPYKTDRMIHQLKLAGVFERISALIVGQFTDYEEDEQMYDNLQQSIFNVVKDDAFPVCFNFPVGHVKQNYPLIMGATASLRVADTFISFTQKK
ncbi:MAG: LD-carboxypeptidase [Bacteroidales bacterium]|jgi:muramoyltetrapeptide carboxypeptidase|nr:LD-carboxypeptidase [Bacteroidales bacterium]